MITLNLSCNTSDFFQIAHTMPDGVTWRVIAVVSEDKLDQLAWKALKHTLDALGFVYIETRGVIDYDLVDTLWIVKDEYTH